MVTQVDIYKLRKEGCEWWAAEVDVLPYGLVLDFVLSDSSMQAWDNNSQQASPLCSMHTYENIHLLCPCDALVLGLTGQI
jgi:hypothetical protein